MKIFANGTMFGLLAAALFAAPACAANSTLNAASDGTVSAQNVSVVQISGSAIYGRLVWGQAFVRITILVNQQGSTTEITKDHGGIATVQDIQPGDVLSADGHLAFGSESLTIVADHVKDSALQHEPKALFGTLKSLDANQTTFLLPNKALGNTIVDASGAVITKGVRSIVFGELKNGDKILSVSGDYDYTSNTLAAKTITVYQDKSVFLPRNFEGTLKSLDSTTLPTKFVATVGATDYTVYLPQGATVMSVNKAPTNLSRFAIGDKVRFFGSIRQTNLSEVDTSVVRDLNF